MNLGQRMENTQGRRRSTWFELNPCPVPNGHSSTYRYSTLQHSSPVSTSNHARYEDHGSLQRWRSLWGIFGGPGARQQYLMSVDWYIVDSRVTLASNAIVPLTASTRSFDVNPHGLTSRYSESSVLRLQPEYAFGI
jgi:hypothetical protein